MHLVNVILVGTALEQIHVLEFWVQFLYFTKIGSDIILLNSFNLKKLLAAVLSGDGTT